MNSRSSVSLLNPDGLPLSSGFLTNVLHNPVINKSVNQQSREEARKGRAVDTCLRRPGLLPATGSQRFNIIPFTTEDHLQDKEPLLR